MPTRLLSLLSDIERALQTESPAPAEGPWEISRMINFQTGLARLSLSSRSAGPARLLGSILLQAFDLADRSFCLKANLFWTDGQGGFEVVHALYEKPGLDWVGEARQIAAKWLAGPPAAKLEAGPKLEEAPEPLAATG
jgi:hypothetical protein